MALLRRRLLAEPGTPTQDVAAPVQAVSAGGPGAVPAAQQYDPALASAVKKFQGLSGLRPDGVVAGETLRMLNIPLDQRIDQIILNMERWRWIPKRLEKDYLLVNIPDYKLHVVENGSDVLDMAVIVGKTLHENAGLQRQDGVRGAGALLERALQHHRPRDASAAGGRPGGYP